MQKPSTFQFFFALCLILALAGCASTTTVRYGNNAINDANLAKIRKGLSKLEVKNILGDPLSQTTGPMGEMWTYTYSEQQQTYAPVYKPLQGNKAEGFARSVVITFSAAGSVENVTQTTTNLYQPVTVNR